VVEVAAADAAEGEEVLIVEGSIILDGVREARAAGDPVPPHKNSP